MKDGQSDIADILALFAFRRNNHHELETLLLVASQFAPFVTHFLAVVFVAQVPRGIVGQGAVQIHNPQVNWVGVSMSSLTQRIGALGTVVVFTIASSAIPTESAAENCKVNDARAALSNGSASVLCDCRTVTRGVVKYIQNREDFVSVLGQVGAACQPLATLLSDVPTATVPRRRDNPDNNDPDRPFDDGFAPRSFAANSDPGGPSDVPDPNGSSGGGGPADSGGGNDSGGGSDADGNDNGGGDDSGGGNETENPGLSWDYPGITFH